MKIKKQNKGFTLIELLVVVSIISLLSSVVLASLKMSRERANYARVESDIHQIKIALSIYASENNGNFPKANATRSCIGANNCIFMGNTISDSIAVLPDNNNFFLNSKINEMFVKIAHAANIFPDFTNAPIITKSNQKFKGYIYDSSACTLAYCKEDQAYIIYPGDPNDSNDPLAYNVSVGSFKKTELENPSPENPPPEEPSSGGVGVCTISDEYGGETNYFTYQDTCGVCNNLADPGTITQQECVSLGQCVVIDYTNGSVTFDQNVTQESCQSGEWIGYSFSTGSWGSCENNPICSGL